VVLLLFGSTRLPGAAEALGKSMRIFKREMKDMHDDDKKPAQADAPVVTQAGVLPPASQQLPTPPADATQLQIADLQRQLAELQRQSSAASGTQSAASGAQAADTPRDQAF